MEYSTLTLSANKIKTKTLKEQVQYVYKMFLSNEDILVTKQLLIPYFSNILYALKQANKAEYKGDDIIENALKILESKK